MTDSTNTKQNTSNNKNKPVHTTRFGCAKAAIWKNTSGNHSITLERIYKDENEQWQSTQSFGRDDIPKLIKTLEAAYDYLFTAESERAACRKISYQEMITAGAIYSSLHHGALCRRGF